MVVTSNVTILESPHEPLPVRLAAQDRRQDFGRLFGVRPRIVTRRGEAGPADVN